MQSEFIRQMGLSNSLSAGMAELADALDLGSSVHDVQVQVLLSAALSADFTGFPVGSALFLLLGKSVEIYSNAIL